MCPQGGRKPDVKVQIKRDELKTFVKNECENNFDELKDIVSPGAKNFQKQIKYIGGLLEKGFFGKLTKKKLAIEAATIFGGNAGYIEKRL